MTHRISTSLPRKSKSGYSLVELITVIGVISVTSSTALLSVSKQQPGMQLRQASWEVTTHLRKARMQAISENLPAQISFDNTAHTISVWVDADEDGTADVGEETAIDLSVYGDLSFWCYPEQGNFSSRGSYDPDDVNMNMQVVYISAPSIGVTEYVYIYPNGSVSLATP